jgi:EmrB/QacA subfamily drug resistance transporter
MTTASKTAVSSNYETWTLVATILASSMAFIDSTALRVALPALQEELNVSGVQQLWVENAYMLFLSALILIGGSLGDHYGRKRIFMFGIILFTAASIFCGIATTPEMLIAARVVQGIGGALMVPGSLAIISAIFEPSKRGRAIGTWSTFSTLTTLLGPFVAGLLIQYVSWRFVFFINIPLALIALWALIRYVPETRDESGPKQLDYLGAFLVTIGLAGITYGFTEAPQMGFGAPLIIASLVIGLVALIAFVIVESRSDHPMVPLRLFKSRTFSGTNALTLFLYAALGALPFFLNFNLQNIQGYTPLEAGLAFVPLGVLLAVMSRWAGGLIDKMGARLPLIIGPAIAGVGFFLFALPGLTNGISDYWLTYFPAVVVLGVGMGITVAPLTTAVMNSAPSDLAGTASGISNAIARAASVLAVAMLGALALFTFTSGLETRTAPLDLPETAQTELRAEAAKLAGAMPPPSLDAEVQAQVQTEIRWAYIDTFRIIAVISAALAWLSALLAGLLIEKRKSPA